MTAFAISHMRLNVAVRAGSFALSCIAIDDGIVVATYLG